jgi:shikimate kinase
MRIFLIGFMGAGKTTVGRLLAQRLDWGFLDLDEQIALEAGRDVATLFAEEGEPAFRARETRCLAALGARDRLVVATGGGAPTVASNWPLLRDLGRTVWLAPDLEVILARLTPEQTVARPLWPEPAALAALYARRLPAYAAADVKIAVPAGEASEATAARVAEALAESLCAT